MFTIHHYYAQRGNIGDTFIRDGTQRLLLKQRADSRFVEFPVNKPRTGSQPFGLSGVNLDRSNAEANLVVIGGSNLYECRRDGQWGVTTDADSIRALRKPLLLIGIGAGTRLGSRQTPCPPQSAEQMRLLNERAVGSSVRDVFSHAYLKAVGIEGHVMTGCPVTFLFDRPLKFNDSETVIVSCPPTRYRKRRLLYYRLINATRKYMRHCRGLGLRPVVSCQFENDLEPSKRLLPEAAEFFNSPNTEDYYRLYAQARLVVGYRLHAGILSFSLGVPFIPVAFDMRAKAFAETYESADWLIDATRLGLYRSLLDRTARIMAKDATAFERFIAGRQRLGGVMADFMAKSFAQI